MKTRFITLLLGLACALTQATVWAQSWPNRPIRIIVPFTPGGGNDVYARTVARKLQERLGQPVVVENRPGAAGNIGADAVAKSAPDGYTLLLAQNGLSMAPWLTKSLPFDVVKDLAPIGIGVTLPIGLSVSNRVPATTLPELIAYAKANPGKLSYATPGTGTPQHMSTELFMNMTQTKMVHVPYRGASGILVDLISGQVDVYFGALNSQLPHLHAGKIRVLALADRERNAILKDVPTIGETLSGYESVIWFGLMAPAGTPEAIINRLSDEQRAIVAMPDVREGLARAGFDVSPSSAAEMRRVMLADLEKWGRVVKEAGIKVE